MLVKTSEESLFGRVVGGVTMGVYSSRIEGGSSNPTANFFFSSGRSHGSKVYPSASMFILPPRNLILPATRLLRGWFLTSRVTQGQSVQQIRVQIAQVNHRGIECPGRRSTR